MKLIFTNEKRSIELPAGCCLIIGRHEDADIRIPDKHVSRRHDEITEQDGKVFVRDLESHAGTRINGVPVKEKTELIAGDVLSISDFEFRVQPSSGAAATDMAVSLRNNASSSASMPSDPLPDSIPGSGHTLPIYSAQKEQQSLFTEK